MGPATYTQYMYPYVKVEAIEYIELFLQLTFSQLVIFYP